jgi:hypothetical protein
MGDSINMAARLMCHPEAAENMLCDEKTYNLCKSQFQFNLLGETKVKGKALPISIFRPVEILKEAEKKSETTQSLTLIGRLKERTAIRSILGKYINKDIASTMLIEADGGHGLNTLFDVIRAEAASRNFICMYFAFSF